MTGRYQSLGEFGARLRRLREDSGLNGKQLAAVLSWPHSKVSKVELGRQRPTAEEVSAWVAATGAGDQLDDLLIDLRSSRVESAPWRRQLRGGHAPRQRASVRLEASAQVIRAFEPAVIPGLLQTADYARQFMTKHADLHQIDSVIEDGVRARMQRQQILYEPDKELRFLVTEATLRYRPCTPSTLRGQLDRLIAVSGLDTVDLAVLPFEAELPMTTSHGFWIFDDRLVLVETLSSEISLRDNEDVQLYIRHFERLWQSAATGAQARAILTRVLSDLDEE